VPKNFLNVTLDELYVYDSLQDDVETTETTNGKKDAISLLYSTEDVEEYVTFPMNHINGYETLANSEDGKNLIGPTWTLKVLISGTYENFFSV